MDVSNFPLDVLRYLSSAFSCFIILTHISIRYMFYGRENPSHNFYATIFGIFFQNNINYQTILLVSMFSKLFRKLTSQVQQTWFWSAKIKSIELDFI